MSEKESKEGERLKVRMSFYANATKFVECGWLVDPWSQAFKKLNKWPCK